MHQQYFGIYGDLTAKQISKCVDFFSVGEYIEFSGNSSDGRGRVPAG
jgi:hypothetical protein